MSDSPSLVSHNLITMRQLTVSSVRFGPLISTIVTPRRRDLRRGSYCAVLVIKARITLRTILNEPYYDGREPSIHGTIAPYAILQTVRIKFRSNRKRRG